MNRTRALFSTAAALFVGAVAIDFWPSGAPAPTPPTPIPEPPPANTPPPPTANPGASLALGDAVRLSASLSNSYVKSGVEGELFLKIDLDANKASEGERQPMAVAIVLDRSGSMAGEKMDQAKTAAKALADRLTDRDQLTLISYATDVSVDLPLSPISDANRSRVHRIIDEIFDGGGTNLSGGMQSGIAQLRQAAQQGLVARAILLSDGNANQGITDPRAIARIARQARSGGISVSSLGVGVDFNEDLMALISENGGGTYYYARNGAAIGEALDNELKGLIRLAARHVEVGLQLGDGVAIQQVYGYRTEARRGQVMIPIGDMHGGQHRKVVVRLAVPARSAGATDIAQVSLAYTRPEGGDQEFRGALSAVATADTQMIESHRRHDVEEAAEGVLAAAEQEKAIRAFADGKKERALNILRRQARRTRARAKSLNSPVLLEQAQQLEGSVRSYHSFDSASVEGKDLIKSQKAAVMDVNKY